MEPLICGDAATKRWQKGKPSPLSSISPPEDEEELCLVMQEIADALGATTVVLTIQEDDQDRSVILRTSNNAFDEQTLHHLHEDSAFVYNEVPGDVHLWRSITVGGVPINIMILPVRRTPGHRRMVLSALFNVINKIIKAKAERVYLKRRPFAIGYFRLWQIDRARQSREKALEETLNLFGMGLILIDSDTNIVFSNIVALDIMKLGDGLILNGGQIHAGNLVDAVRLRTALDYIIAPGARESLMLAITRASGPPLTLLALPIAWGEPEIGSVAAAIYIIDPAANVISVLEPLCKIYQLTSSESKLTCLLAIGNSLANSAEIMKVKEQTARSMLKLIFRKTGTARQSELIVLIFSSIVKVHHEIRFKVL